MKPAVLLAVVSVGLGASQAWADCEKTAYVESVRVYAGDTNNHIFVREKGVNSPLFVANTRDSNFVRGALQAHVHRMPVLITTIDSHLPVTQRWAVDKHQHGEEPRTGSVKPFRATL